MGLFDTIRNIFGGKSASSTPEQTPSPSTGSDQSAFWQSNMQPTPQPTQSVNLCTNACGRPTDWHGHALCRICWAESNPNKPISPSRMNSYHAVIASSGATGQDETTFRTNLMNNRGFYPEHVDALCASPTLRSLMGW